MHIVAGVLDAVGSSAIVKNELSPEIATPGCVSSPHPALPAFTRKLRPG